MRWVRLAGAGEMIEGVDDDTEQITTFWGSTNQLCKVQSTGQLRREKQQTMRRAIDAKFLLDICRKETLTNRQQSISRAAASKAREQLTCGEGCSFRISASFLDLDGPLERHGKTRA
jgi:hypothetical protein